MITEMNNTPLTQKLNEAQNPSLRKGVVGCSFILNNKERPKDEGVYEVIRSDGSYDFNYFDGKHWLIDFENGKRPVREWR